MFSFKTLKTEGLSEAASKFCTGKRAKQLKSMATLLNMAKGGSGYDKSDILVLILKMKNSENIIFV